MLLIRLAFILAVSAFIASCSTTEPPEAAVKVAGRSFLPEKGRTMAPFAHVVFCVDSPGQCKNRGGSSVVELTEKTQTLLGNVNDAINGSIIPLESPGQPWQINPVSGDCNDYAVSKRSRLIQAGLPTRAVRLAIAVTPQGVGHTVVVVRTTNGDVVLDNRTSAIKRWDKTDLSWLKVQSSNNPQNWDRL